MSNDFYSGVYNPDVLSCLANLSNDEVFTPPEIVNRMLDMLPEELFSNPSITFLDPSCKSGVFLREIAKRLIKGLEPLIPDLQQRIDHIFKSQLYGISITELTSLLSRRSIYCSKYPNSIYSISEFDDPSGNIRYKKISHRWKEGKCVFCGASQNQYDRSDDLETHAYELIHTNKPEEIFKMKFDVIIGNPPYQLTTGGGQGATASPIYDKFIQQAKKLKPRYLSMIVPARWYSGGLNLDMFRNEMINDKRIKELHDFPDASECFTGVDIKGGVMYFLWDRDYEGECRVVTHEKGEIKSHDYRMLKEKGSDIFIRYNEAVSILRKVQQFNEKSFENLVSPRDPFGYTSNFSKFYNVEEVENPLKLYYLGWQKKGIKYVDYVSVRRGHEYINQWKVIIPKAFGSGDISTDNLKPILCEPRTVCTETYLTIGPLNDKQTAVNVKSYIETKFFHFMVGLKKNTQNAYRIVYTLVPQQDFSKTWKDQELYSKYSLTEEEINFIESSVWPDKKTLCGDNND